MFPNHQPLVWIHPRETPSLRESEVHIWRADLDAVDHRIADFHCLLSDREVARIKRLKVPLVAKRYAVSRGILRQLLGLYAATGTSTLQFKYGAIGKPFLEPINGRTLSFNNTDSGGLALYAIAVNRELGIDLERLPRRVRARRIAQRRFAASEARAINDGPPAELDQRFLRCWTRKEAWGKAKGFGIRYPMRNIELCNMINDPIFTLTDEVGDWRGIQFNADEASTACIVAEGFDWRLRAFHYDYAIMNCHHSP